MSVGNSGDVLFYNWEIEREFRKRFRQSRKKETDDTTAVPRIGFRWRYYPQGKGEWLKSPVSGRLHLSGQWVETKGVVISWNKYSGVICTDAGEILMRG